MSEHDEAQSENILSELELVGDENLQRATAAIDKLYALQERLFGYEPPASEHSLNDSNYVGALLRVRERGGLMQVRLDAINQMLNELVAELGARVDNHQEPGETLARASCGPRWERAMADNEGVSGKIRERDAADPVTCRSGRSPSVHGGPLY